MLDIINLALPFFGLIFLGFACGKLKRIPDTGLAWMNFFIVYVALPALFYRILAQTPLDQLAQVRFIVGTTLATLSAFCLAFAVGFAMRRRHVAEATIAGLAGSFGNIGYMGPGLALATLGAASAALHFEPPVALDRLMGFLQNAAAPCALFVLGVTVALRPLDRMPWEVPFLVAIKLAIHPAIVLVLLSLLGPFSDAWMAAAVLMAALPPALNVFVMARQYDSWVAQASGSVLLGTLASVVTLTAVMWLVKTHGLPLHLFH